MLFILPFVSLQAQERVEPGSKDLNSAYFRPRNIFQKLSWIDKEGMLTRQATLNCVTKIDSIHKKLIYLQIRNDGKRDSTIVEWPMLKPIYTVTVAGDKAFIYDYRGGEVVKNTVTQDGRKTSGEMLKSIYRAADGSIFMKSRI